MWSKKVELESVPYYVGYTAMAGRHAAKPSLTLSCSSD